VYAYTSSWVAGLFQIIPFLGTLIMLIGGLYSIYLLYLGLPKLMKSPEDKSIAYTLVVIVCAIVVSFVIMAIGGMFITAGMVGRGMFGGVPGGAVQAQLDPNTPLGKLEQIGQKLDESAKKMDAAQKSGDGNAQVAAALEGLGALLGGGRRVEPLETDQLKAFVPETLGGFPRTSSRAERSGVAGLMVAKAEADYGDAQKAIALEVTDTGGVSGLVGLASWAGVMGESEDDNGFERTRKVGDRIVHEKGSKHQGGTNEFGIVLGNRFVVSAKSSSVSLDDLKAAVAAMDLGKLEVLKDANVK
jgi:hypothetical protein